MVVSRKAIYKRKAMNKRSELIAEMRAGREELENLLNQFTDAEMLKRILPGEWSIKDLLAHFDWWANRAANLYGILSRNEAPPDEDITLDELNARVYAENQNRSLDDVRRTEREAYHRLLDLVAQAPEDDLFKPDRFAWIEGRPFVTWITSNSAGHYAEHIGDLKTWLTANK
jgi:hypothetical protein